MSAVGQCRPGRNGRLIGRQASRTDVLLLALGVPRWMLFKCKKHGEWFRGRRSLWELDDSKLWAVLEEAEHRFFKAIKKAHPDARNGNLEQAKRLNMMWKTIKERFKEHGYELQ